MIGAKWYGANGGPYCSEVCLREAEGYPDTSSGMPTVDLVFEGGKLTGLTAPAGGV